MKLNEMTYSRHRIKSLCMIARVRRGGQRSRVEENTMSKKIKKVSIAVENEEITSETERNFSV